MGFFDIFKKKQDSAAADIPESRQQQQEELSAGLEKTKTGIFSKLARAVAGRSTVDADLLDDVACLSSDYSFYLNVGSNYHCLKFLNFQRVTVNLSLSTDLLFKVATVTSYFSMNSEGRMSFIEQVKESVEKAAEEMREFNESVRSTVIYKSMKGHNRKTYYQGRLAAFTRHTN